LSRRVAAHPLCRNQVSFFLGELVIRHGCNPFPGRMERQPVSLAPQPLQRVLHLLCESARPNLTVNPTRRFMLSTWRSTRRCAGFPRR
jgi:hypothetical protein